MKKLIIAFLIVVLIFPFSFSLAVEDWLIEGAWTHVEDTGDGMLITSMYLFEDGKAYYVTQVFNGDKVGPGRSFVGSWEFTGIDTIHVVIGNNSSMNLTYHTFNMMFDHELREYYFRAELRDGDPLQ